MPLKQGFYLQAEKPNDQFLHPVRPRGASTNMTGPRWPMDIRKTTCDYKQSSFRENITCNARKETAVRGTNRSDECPHIKSIPYATRGIMVDMLIRSLDDLFERNIITSKIQ